MSENRQRKSADGVMITGMELLDRQACYRVFQTHDARFDGRRASLSTVKDHQTEPQAIICENFHKQ